MGSETSEERKRRRLRAPRIGRSSGTSCSAKRVVEYEPGKYVIACRGGEPASARVRRDRGDAHGDPESTAYGRRAEVLGDHGDRRGSRWRARWRHVTIAGQTSAAAGRPIETFFKKIVAIRETPRVLEQKINAHATLAAEGSRAAGYITRCRQLTTFNALFASEAAACRPERAA